MKASKFLGQHFLKCQWVVATLVKAAELKKSDTVLEIGPGTGILTRALAKNAGQIIAVEKDEKLAELLHKEKIPNVVVVTGDILKLLKSDFRSLEVNRFKMVANIPYYLTSRLFRLLLEGSYKPEFIVMTIQKEVAERICAKPPKMNLLGLSVQTYGTPQIIASVPSSCFSPRPKVDSAIIQVSDISDVFFHKNGLDKKLFFDIAKQGFSQKRKVLANTLKKFRGKEKAKNMLKELNLSLSRPQELSLQDWVKIASFLQKTESVES